MEILRCLSKNRLDTMLREFILFSFLQIMTPWTFAARAPFDFNDREETDK